MKKLIVVLAFLFVSCNNVSNSLCPFASIGLMALSTQLTNKIGTCSPVKMTNLVLEKMKCPTNETVVAEKSISEVVGLLCQPVVDIVASIIASQGNAALDCDPAILTGKITDLNLCELIK